MRKKQCQSSLEDVSELVEPIHRGGQQRSTILPEYQRHYEFRLLPLLLDTFQVVLFCQVWDFVNQKVALAHDCIPFKREVVITTGQNSPSTTVTKLIFENCTYLWCHHPFALIKKMQHAMFTVVTWHQFLKLSDPQPNLLHVTNFLTTFQKFISTST